MINKTKDEVFVHGVTVRERAERFRDNETDTTSHYVPYKMNSQSTALNA